MNLVTQYRREVFLRHVSVGEQSGLEIGPHNQPMVTKGEGNVAYMDFLTRTEHIEAQPNVEFIDDIPETDIIISDNEYNKYTSTTYDYIIANHVLEHAPDMIAFLHMMESMLNDDGVIFLALPDKKFSFDIFRQNTTLAHVINDFLSGPQCSLRQHMIEDLLYYDRSFIGCPQNVVERMSRSLIEEKYHSVPHYGLHCHVFQSETFIPTLLAPLLQMKFASLDIAEFVPAAAERGGEMILVLRRGTFTGKVTSESFYDRTNSVVNELRAD